MPRSCLGFLFLMFIFKFLKDETILSIKQKNKILFEFCAINTVNTNFLVTLFVIFMNNYLYSFLLNIISDYLL